MALQEYSYNGSTYLFEADDAPESAELIGDIAESVQPLRAVDGEEGYLVLPEDKLSEEKAEPEAPANKAAKAKPTK